jgi:hypothetical protein
VTETLGRAGSDAHLDALAKAAAILEWPLPRECDDATCHELALIVDALLVRVARGRGALDVALGEALDALGGGARSLKVGYASIGDYAREELGIAASTAQKMARFARALRDRPILRAAVRAGEVTLRAAEAVLPRAKGEVEAAWVERARAGSVRGLKAAVKQGVAAATSETIGEAEEAPSGFAVPEDDEKWGRVQAVVTPEQQARIDAGLRFARKLVGAAAPKWQLLRAMCQDHLGGHELPGPALGPDDLLPAPREEVDGIKEWLEKESAQWAFLDQPAPIEAPELCEGAARDAGILHGELRRLSLLRERWDEVFGHLALLFRSVAGWRWLDFASFEHYCTERLGMAVRSVEQRAALERDLYELPALREAMCARRISYEKARLIARHADEKSIDAWIARAEGMPCIALRRELEKIEETQACARGHFEVWAPRQVTGLVALACCATRKAAGRWISTGECLARIADEFVETWQPVLDQERNTLHKQILERDEGLCRVPGCSRAADHAHHIVYRSAGGSDDPSNLISLCAAHHLHCVHMGWIRVAGTAPDGLRWVLGVGTLAA